MNLLPWKSNQTRKFDTKTLRKNDISLLILDERWNKLFNSTPRTPAIERSEEKLKELLKEEARLTAEQKNIAALKKQHMDRIIKLTPDVFEKNDAEAQKEMQASEREIKRINDRAKQIEDQLDEMPGRLKQANLELLELTVNIVYFKIRSSKKRVEELEKLIEETREKLKGYIDEKESLSQDDTDIYSYFHDLLGGEELEKLDREFFG
jgi:phage terminase Nu1 subunit (DNA packaging protein)